MSHISVSATSHPYGFLPDDHSDRASIVELMFLPYGAVVCWYTPVFEVPIPMSEAASIPSKPRSWRQLRPEPSDLAGPGGAGRLRPRLHRHEGTNAARESAALADKLLGGKAVATVSFGALEGLDRRPHLFPDGPAQETADRMWLPASRLQEFLQGHAA